MSGHSKWSKIKHKKGAADAVKSKIFSQIAKMLAVESKKSAGNADSPNVRALIEKAKSVNMPKENIERAIKKGASKDAASMENVVYEAYGPGGVALIIEGLTDNKNRSSAEVRHILAKNGLGLAAPGSALWAFKKIEGEWTPAIITPLPDEDRGRLEDVVDELENIEDVDGVYTNAETAYEGARD
ncbi:YebC/PmpR family DNA-binding transcriptional regulator [bacterium]|nr:YebC/PmpR family DNA-binding transcriptional regulator [bacterium]